MKTKLKEVISTDNTCFVVSGPPGGHKFALAVNLLLNHEVYDFPSENQKPRKLIISLAEEGNIKLEDVALHEKLDNWRNLLKKRSESDNARKSRKDVTGEVLNDSSKINKVISKISFGSEEEEVITVLQIEMGTILPEEVLFIISKYLRDNPQLDSILVDNTDHIRNRFPSLHREQLFTPALVDIIKKSGCYSVFVDICTDATRPDRHSRALSSLADLQDYH